MDDEIWTGLGIAVLAGTAALMCESYLGKNINSIRRDTPCKFNEGVSSAEFAKFALRCSKEFPRIDQVSVNGALITCTVKAVSGITRWKFQVDFNDWGHVNGTYWLRNENSDSSIPKNYARLMQNEITSRCTTSGIFDDMSSYVDKNSNLASDDDLQLNESVGFIRRRHPRLIQTGFNSAQLCGEHVFPIFSYVKDHGFKRIESIPVYDVDDLSSHYAYEVALVTIDGRTVCYPSEAFSELAEVKILYHQKKKVRLESSRRYHKMPYQDVVNDLFRRGFTNVYTRKIEDLKIGWMTKDGSTERVVLGNDEPCRGGLEVYYDTKIVVVYHTFHN